MSILKVWSSRDHVDPLPHVRDWTLAALKEVVHPVRYIWPSVLDSSRLDGLASQHRIVAVRDAADADLLVRRLTGPQLWTMLVDAPGLDGFLNEFYMQEDVLKTKNDVLGLSAADRDARERSRRTYSINTLIAHDADEIVRLPQSSRG